VAARVHPAIGLVPIMVIGAPRARGAPKRSSS
jgi:hypothetical protein